MQSTQTGELNFPDLPIDARLVHIFTSLASGSLLSIGQLAEHGCKEHFNKTHVYITKDDRIVLVGHRSKETNGMWEMNMQPITSTPTTYKVNAIMKLPGVADKVNFYIACMFSPTIETICTDIDVGHLQSFPGHLTSAQV